MISTWWANRISGRMQHNNNNQISFPFPECRYVIKSHRPIRNPLYNHNKTKHNQDVSMGLNIFIDYIKHI